MILEIEDQQINVCMQEHTKRLPTVVLSAPNFGALNFTTHAQIPDWTSITQSHNTLQYNYIEDDLLASGVATASSLTWFKMAEILCQLLNKVEVNRVIFAGSSIGAGISLHAAALAAKFGIEVQGIVAILPPFLDHARKNRAEEITSSGIPTTDSLKKIICPTLILSTAGDTDHPISAAENIAKFIDGSVLKVAADRTEINEWQDIVSAFLVQNSKARRSLVSG